MKMIVGGFAWFDYAIFTDDSEAQSMTNGAFGSAEQRAKLVTDTLNAQWERHEIQ